MSKKDNKFFDFFDVKKVGKPNEKVKIKSANGETRTYWFECGFIEDFSWGWNKETTYDLYRKRIDALLELAEQHEDESDTCQALLASALVFAVAGLESLVRAVSKKGKRPNQSSDEFFWKVEANPEYQKLDTKDKTALSKLFQVRHAVVHCGLKMTPKLNGKINRRAPVGEDLMFESEKVLEVINAADRFALRIAQCFDKSDAV